MKPCVCSLISTLTETQLSLNKLIGTLSIWKGIINYIFIHNILYIISNIFLVFQHLLIQVDKNFSLGRHPFIVAILVLLYITSTSTPLPELVLIFHSVLVVVTCNFWCQDHGQCVPFLEQFSLHWEEKYPTAA